MPGAVPARRRRAFVGMLAAVVLLMAAWGGDDVPAASGEVPIDAADASADTEVDAVSVPVVDVVATGEEAADGSMTHRFEPLTGVTAGPTQFNLVNEGMEPHAVQLLKLNDG